MFVRGLFIIYRGSLNALSHSSLWTHFILPQTRNLFFGNTSSQYNVLTEFFGVNSLIIPTRNPNFYSCTAFNINMRVGFRRTAELKTKINDLIICARKSRTHQVIRIYWWLDSIERHNYTLRSVISSQTEILKYPLNKTIINS